MALHRAMRRLEIGAPFVCTACRRTVATSSPARQQAQTRTALADTTLKSRKFEHRYNRVPGRRPSPPTTSTQDVPGPTDKAIDVARASLRASEGARRQRQRDQVLEVQRRLDREEYERQLTRRWKTGDVYAPHDLSGVEMSKWEKNKRAPVPKKVAGGGDVLDQLGMNPMHHYKNFTVMSEYLTLTGRIKHSNETGLRPVNQRRMARAVRRAVGIGLLPAVHRHPELIIKDNERKPF